MRKNKYWFYAGLTVLSGLFLTAPALAASQNTNASSLETVAQAYKTEKPLQQGILVELKDKNAGEVAAVGYKDAAKLFGVVVAANQAPVTLSSSQTQQQAYVITSGQYDVLVSTQNGSIKPGDYVSVSAIDGIAMKADANVLTVLGRATAGFDGKNSLSSTDLKSSNGKQLKAAIGSIMVNVAIQPNPLHVSGNSGVPNVVQKIAVSLVGKPINALQLYVGAAILVIGLCIVASLLYGGIKTSMTAIGRNPLARKSIMRNLIQVIVTSIMIFIGCLVAVYLIMKL